MALIILIVTVAFIAIIAVLILVVIHRRRRVTKGHISIMKQVQHQDSANPAIDGENYYNSDEDVGPEQSIENNEFGQPNLCIQNAQYASEDIENPRDKARRRVYFRNVLEDAGRHEVREDQQTRLQRLELER